MYDAKVKQEPISFYKKHEKIYSRPIWGRFTALRTIGVVVLLGLYYVMAWVRIDGQQAILFDLQNRKFHVLWFTFWPQDFIYMSLLLLAAALTLFFFTALAGRLWCGFACPQTVWTEIFIWMERLVEGNDRKQRKLDQGPHDMHWWSVKTAKHALWVVFSFWTGLTFVGYFTPIRDLIDRMWIWQWGGWETFWVFFYGFATYGNAGFLREQICFYMCPYARFQSVMFDKDTMIVTYDKKRGEPRGRRRRGERPAWLGDCVDCHKCVQVCPTGIDIRNGLQYQCIGCGSCVDACDDVMKKMGYPTGLVRFSSQRVMEEGGRTRILRPRVLLYGTLLTVVLGLSAYSALFRMPLRLEAIRDRNVLYREVPGGRIENVFTLKVANMDDKTHRFIISVSGLPDAMLGTHEVTVPSGAVETVPVRLSVDASRMNPGSAPFLWYVEAQDNPALQAKRESRFLVPVAQP